jgi:hypothetical protein
MMTPGGHRDVDEQVERPPAAELIARQGQADERSRIVAKMSTRPRSTDHRVGDVRALQTSK